MNFLSALKTKFPLVPNHPCLLPPLQHPFPKPPINSDQPRPQAPWANPPTPHPLTLQSQLERRSADQVFGLLETWFSSSHHPQKPPCTKSTPPLLNNNQPRLRARTGMPKPPNSNPSIDKYPPLPTPIWLVFTRYYWLNTWKILWWGGLDEPAQLDYDCNFVKL